MSPINKIGRLAVLTGWIGLLLWQLCWHAILPPPAGSDSWMLAGITVLPLLLLTPGVIKIRHKSLVWGMFLAMLYFIVAVMETWSNADQRVPAIIQIILSCGFFLGLVLLNRPDHQAPE